jgi:allophanate hydrolase
MNSGDKSIHLAVVGAHLRGQPLNHQLTHLGAVFVRADLTAPFYRLYALLDTDPSKPGLIRIGAGGVEIKVEVWRLPMEKFGAFIEKVTAPLCIGTIELKDGESVKGFLCEPHAIPDARNITKYGGWEAYLEGGMDN